MLIKTEIRKLFVDELHYNIPALKTVNDSHKNNLSSSELPLGIVWTNDDTIVEDDERLNAFGNCGHKALSVETDLVIELYLSCITCDEEQVDLISVGLLKIIFEEKFNEKLKNLGVTDFVYVSNDINRSTEQETPITIKTFDFTVKYDLETLLNGSK